MTPSVPPAIITGMMAKPSKPSVRLTALAEPTITIMPKGTKNMPRLIMVFFRNGSASWLVNSAEWKRAAA